jgi:hypothetical protein
VAARFGLPLVLSRVHWVRPERVVEVSYAERTPDGLLRHVVYLGEREDKPASVVHRERRSNRPNRHLQATTEGQGHRSEALRRVVDEGEIVGVSDPVFSGVVAHDDGSWP